MVAVPCGRPPRQDISLHVDQDHATGAIRELLCFPCNNLLGDAGDRPELLRAASSYLQRHQPPDELTVLAKARARELVRRT